MQSYEEAREKNSPAFYNRKFKTSYFCISSKEKIIGHSYNLIAIFAGFMKDSIVQIKNKNPKLFTFLAQLVSYVFHPIFMPTAMTLIIFYLNPISFITADNQQKMVWIGNIALNTFFFPAIFVLLLKALGFIESLKMDIQKERIIPLIGTMVFYFWAYHIFRNIDPPFILRVFLLGCFWGIIAVFMINIFLKI